MGVCSYKKKNQVVASKPEQNEQKRSFKSMTLAPSEFSIKLQEIRRISAIKIENAPILDITSNSLYQKRKLKDTN